MMELRSLKVCFSVAITFTGCVIYQNYEGTKLMSHLSALYSGTYKNACSVKGGLPEVAVVPRVWHKYPGKKWQGLQLPVLTTQPFGRLGNVMGEYASLYAIGRIFNVTVRLHPHMKNGLYQIFPNITMPLIPSNFASANITIILSLDPINYAKAEAAAAGLLGPHIFLIQDYPFEIQLFNTYRQDILREFTFSPAIRKQVQQFWNKALINIDNRKSLVAIGFHVRRTDYVNFIKAKFQSELPGEKYFSRALNYYREKYKNVLFVVASDNTNYTKKAFAKYPDVIHAPGDPRELDMAVLASCNHSIITVGSFGFWTGYLTGGEVVYPNISASNTYPFAQPWYKLGHLNFFTPLPVN